MLRSPMGIIAAAKQVASVLTNLIHTAFQYTISDYPAPYLFSGVAIGTAAADRRVVVGVFSAAAAAHAVTGVTIGGITATQDGAAALTGNRVLYAFSAIVPTGTTADVVVTYSGTPVRCGITVETTNGDPTGQTDSSDLVNDTLTVVTSPGDVLFVWGCSTGGNTSPTFVWGGTVTEFFNTMSVSDGGQYSRLTAGVVTATSASSDAAYTTVSSSQRGALAVAYRL